MLFYPTVHCVVGMLGDIWIDERERLLWPYRWVVAVSETIVWTTHHLKFIKWLLFCFVCFFFNTIYQPKNMHTAQGLNVLSTYTSMLSGIHYCWSSTAIDSTCPGPITAVFNHVVLVINMKLTGYIPYLIIGQLVWHALTWNCISLNGERVTGLFCLPGMSSQSCDRTVSARDFYPDINSMLMFDRTMGQIFPQFKEDSYYEASRLNVCKYPARINTFRPCF